MLEMAGTDERIVAVLHDVVEDHGDVWPLDRIKSEGFSQTVLDAIDAVTHRKAAREGYFAYVARAVANLIGRRVKGGSQCGGFRAKPVVICDFSAPKPGEECWSQKGWRRECD